MIKRSDVLKVLFQYFDSKIDLNALRDWLVRVDVSGDADYESRQFLALIEGCYAEFSDGLLSEELLRSKLLSIVRTVESTWFVEEEGNRSSQQMRVLEASGTSLVQPRLELT